MNQRIQQGVALLAGLTLVLVVWISRLPDPQSQPSPSPRTPLSVLATQAPFDATVLYISSTVVGSGVSDVRGAQMSAFAVQTQQSRVISPKSAETVFAPDATTVYALTDELTAINMQTGQPKWHISVASSPGYMGGGPPLLATSSDGRWLYIASHIPGDDTTPSWLQIIETATGRRLSTIVPLPNCRAPQMYTPAQREQLYILCPTELRILDTATQSITERQQVGLSEWHQAVPAADGSKVYIVGISNDVAIYDTDLRTIKRVELLKADVPLANSLAVALSSDGTKLVVAQSIQEQVGTDNATLFRIIDTR
jgi:hypothetical protein